MSQTSGRNRRATGARLIRSAFNRSQRIAAILALFSMLWYSVLPAGADPANYWQQSSDGTPDATWDNSLNWSLGTPTATSDLIFPADIPATGSTITLGAGELANSLTFGNSYILTGGDLTLGATGNITVAPSSTATINSVLMSAGALTLGVDNGLTVPDFQAGGGTLVLGGANLYSGGTSINAGTLQITNVGALGSGDATVNAGTTLEAVTAAGALTSGVILNGGTFKHTPSVQLSMVAGKSFNVIADSTINVVANGPGGKLFLGANQLASNVGTTLTKIGNGDLQLSAANPGFLGSLNVNGGFLEFQNVDGLGTGVANVTVNSGGEFLTTGVAVRHNFTLNTGATLSANGNGGAAYTGTINVAGNSTIALRQFQGVNTPNSMSISGVLSGAGNLTVNAPAGTTTAVGSLLLTGANGGYTSTITVNKNAQVRGLQGATADGLGSAAIVLNGGTLGISPQLTGPGAGGAGFRGGYYIGAAANVTSNITDGVVGGYDFGVSGTNLPRVADTTRVDPVINFPDFTQQGAANQRPTGFNPTGNANFGALWTGVLNITTGGAYTFNTASDDGSLLYIDGQPTVLNDFSQGTTTRTGVINLDAGYHSIVLKYGQGGGGTNLVANYSGADTGNTLVNLGSVAGSITNSNAILLSTGTTIDNNISLSAGTSSTIDMSATTVTNTGTLTFGANSRLNVTGLTGSEVLTQQGNVTLNGTSSLTVGMVQITSNPGNLRNASAGADVIISGSIGESVAGSSLIKNGPRNVVLSGTNTYTGQTNYSGGTLLSLSAPGGNSIPGNLTLNPLAITGVTLTAREFANDQIADTGVVTLAGYSGVAGSNLDLNNFNDTIGGFTFVNNQGGGTETVSTGAAGTLTLNGNVKVFGTSTGAAQFTGNLNLGGAERVFTTYSVASPVISAVITNGSITKAGLGSLTISSANPAYTGLTTVNGGKLSISNAAALGTSSGGGDNTLVNNGGYLDVNNVSTAEAITLNGNGLPVAVSGISTFGGLQYTGALQGSGFTVANSVSGPITLGSNSSIGAPAGSLLTISGVISDGGSGFSMTKSQGSNAVPIATNATTGGAGILKLTNANTYTGRTAVVGGELWLANNSGQAIQSTDIVIGNGTADSVLTMANTTLGQQQFPTNAIITFANGSKNAKFQLNGTTQTVAGFNSTGSLAIIQNHESAAQGPGTLIVNDPLDSGFSGLIRDQNSTLAFTKLGAGTFTFSGDGAFGTAGATYTGTTTVNAGKLVISDETSFNSPVTVNGTGTVEFNYSYGRTLSYSKVITDNGLGFIKSGGGNLVLTGNSVVSGATNAVNITGGSLIIAGGTGASPILPNAAINVGANGQLDLYGTGGATSYNNNVTLNGITAGGALAGAVNGGTIDNTLSGTITLNATSNISTGWADKTFRMTGKITGPGGLQFDKLFYTQQPPVFQVNNAANDYAGGTTINAGTVYFTAGLPSTGNLKFGGYYTQSTLNILTGPNLVLGTNGITGGFTRAIGTGDGQVSFTGEGGGFSAVGGTQTVSFGGGGSIDWGGTGFNANAALFFNGSNTLAGASAYNADSEVNLTNDIVLSSTGMRRVYVADNNGSTTDQVRFSGAISGAGGLIKDGGDSAGGANLQGRLILGGTSANTYTGLTDVVGGVLALAKPAGVNAIGGDLQIGGVQNNGTRRIVYLGANDQIPDTATVTMLGSNANNGDLRLFGFNETIGALNDRSGGGVVEIAESGDTGFLNVAISTSATSTLTVGANNADSFYNGFLRNNGASNATATGVLNLVKTGTGTFTISAGQQSGNGSQNYSGTTTINDGKLVFANIGTYNSAVTIGATGTLEFNTNIGQSLTEGQVISGTGNLIKSGIGTQILSATTNYGGTTTVNAGTLQITNTQGAAQLGDYVVNGGTLLIGNGNTGGVLSNNNNITVNAGGTVAFSRNNGYTYSGIISGAGNVEGRTGGGNIVLSGTNSYTGTTTVTGGTITLAGSGVSGGGIFARTGGTLSIDFSQPGSGANDIVLATAPVRLGLDTFVNASPGGSLNIVGNANTANSQTLGNVTLNRGLNNITLAAGANGTLAENFGSFSATPGAVLNMTLPAGVSATTTTLNGVGGILGGYATTNNGSNFVAVDALGALSSLDSGAADTYGAGVNTDVVSGGVGASTNSLRFNSATTGSVFFIGTNSIDSGGILVTPNVGNNASTINGDTLTGGVGTGLVITQANTANALTITTVIADNGGPSALTKAGAGSLILTGANTYTGNTIVTQGTLISTGTTGGVATILPNATMQVGDGNTNGVLPASVVNAGTFVVNNGLDQTLSTPFNAVSNFNYVAGAINNPTSLQIGSFQKLGNGTLTITNAVLTNTFHPRAGTVIIDSGGNVQNSNFASIGLANGDNATLTVRGVGRYTVNGDTNISDQNSSRGTLNIQDQAVVTAGTLYVGKTGTSVGVVNQTFGSMINNGGGDWRIGGNGTANADTGAYGIYNLSAGTFQTSKNFQIGASGLGVFNQTGGAVSVTGGFNVVGRFVGSNGLLNINNGTFTNTTTNRMIVGEAGSGVVNISGAGQLLFTATSGGIGIGSDNGGAGAGILNLLPGGLIVTPQVADQNTNASDGTSVFNFNGGTLRVTTGSTVGASFFTGLTSANVFAGGANIDTNGVATTIAQPLLAPTGNGLTGIALNAGGNSYVGEPIVIITGGGGTGATARAIVSGGTVTGFVITNPGTGYTSDPIVTISGGGGTGAMAGAITSAANDTSGGLTKLNTGVLTLTGTSTYGGSTTITGGSITESFTSVGGSNILPATGLVMNGGGLTLTGFAAGTNTQTFANTTISGVGTIVSNIGAGGTMATTLNAITRTGGAVDFSGTGTISTISPNTATSILGGWATFGTTASGQTWAVSAGDGVNAANISGLAAGSYTANTWGGTTNTDMTTAGTVASLSTNSVRFNTAAPATVTVTGTDVINSGGILITPTVTTAGTIFTGGTINSAGTGTDLVVNHFGTAAETIVSAIGANTGGLVKSGPGILILSAPTTTNAYTGATTIGAGTLRIGVTEQIPNGSNVSISAGASLDLNNLGETINGLSGYGSVVNSVAGTPTLTVGASGASSTFSGLIVNGTGNVALTKTGSGILTFNNIVAGSYTGATNINGGAIDIATPLALSNNTNINVNVANGLLFDTTIPQISALGGNSSITLQTQATSAVPNAPVQLTIGNNNAGATYSGSLAGSGTLIKVGSGTEVFTGANANSGGLVVNGGNMILQGNNTNASGLLVVNGGGILQLANSNAIYGSGNVIIASGGVLTPQSFTANPTSVGYGAITPLLGRIDLGSTGVLALQVDGTLQKPITEDLDFSAANLNVTLGAVLNGTSSFGNAPVQYTGVITPKDNTFRLGGSGGRLILSNGDTLAGANNVLLFGGGNGNGQVFLTGAYGYTGSTFVNAGVTIVNNLTDGGVASSIGASSSAASNLVLNGGILQYVGSGSSTDRLFTLTNTPTTLDASGTGPLNFTNTGAIGFLNSGNRTLTLQGSNTGANTIAAAIGDTPNQASSNGNLGNGTTAITKNGNGTWVLSGANTFSGGITINAGVLQFANAASMGANTVNGPASILVNGGGAAAFSPAFNGNIQNTLNRISPLSTGTVALMADTNEDINLDGGSAGATLPGVFLGASGNVSYTGNLTPFGTQYRLGGGGGVLSLPNGGLTGPRSLVIGGGGPGTSFANNPNLNGGVVLGGVSDFTGGTQVLAGGIVSATSLTALGTGPLKIQGGFYRAVDGTDITLASDGVSARDIRLGIDSNGASSTANIDVVGGVNLTLSKILGQAPTYGSNESQVTLTKWGAGNLVLAGGLNLTASSATSATNSGTLIIERGTLSLLSNPTNYNGLVEIGSNNGGVGTLKLGANNVFANTTAQFAAASIFDMYSGSKIDLAGFSDTMRQLRGMGSIVNSGDASANLTVGTNNEISVVGGNLIGNFTLTEGGNVTHLFGTGATINSLELWSNNNLNFTGKLVANAGGIRIRSDGSLGSPTEPFAADKITLNNGAVLLAAGGVPAVIGANHGITLGSTGGTLWAFNTGAPLIVNSPITGPGMLSIADDTGVVLLGNDNNNYTGGTTINSNAAGRGMLMIGAGGATGSLPAGDVFFNSGAGLARLYFFKSADMTLANTFNGPGQIFQIGGGTTTLSGINNTNQTTFVGGGKLRVDFSDPTKSPISPGTVLQISSGTFEYVGPAGDNALRLGALTATNFATPGSPIIVGGVIGDATVQSTYGGSGLQELIFNGNARGTAGVTMNFVTSGGVNGLTNRIEYSSGPTVNNVIGAAYFFNGSDFAALDTNGFVRAANYGVDSNTAALNTMTGSRYTKLTNSITGQGAVSMSGINFSADGVNLTMNAAAALTMNANPGTLLKSGGGLSVIGGGAGATVSNNNQELIVRTDTAADTLRIDLPITGTGQLTKSGLGQLTLTAANTYTGNTLINNGTLLLTGNGQIGTLNAANGSEIRIALTAGQTATLNIDSPTASVSSGAQNNGFRVGEMGNGVVNQSAGTVNSAVFSVLGESLGSTGTYNISGGTFNAKSNNANAPNGQAALIVGRAGTGALNVSGNATVNVKNGAQMLLGAGSFNTGQFQGLVPNAGVSTGVGTVTQTGGTVNVDVNNGAFQSNIFGGVILGVDGAGTYNLNGGTLVTPLLGRGNGTANFNLGGGTLKVAAPVATLPLSIFNLDLPINVTGTGAGKGVIDTNGSDVTMTSAVTGTGGLAKSGNGTLNVIGAGSNYAGGTDINAGTVVSSGTSLGSGTVNVGPNGVLAVQGVQNGLLAKFYALNHTDVTPAVTNGNGNMSPEFATLENFNAYLAGKAPVGVESTAARGKVSVDYLDDGGPAGAGGNTAIPPSLRQIQNGQSPYIANLAGKFNAAVAGDYTFQTRSDDGSAVWIDGVAVVNNNLAQGETVRSGTINLSAGLHDIVVGYNEGGGGSGFSVGVTLPGQGQSFTINGNSELQMSNDLLSYGSSSLTVGSLTGSGAVQLGAGTLIAGGDNTSTEFSGAMSGTGGNLVKQGTGTMTISGTAHTYTGSTTVNGGTLSVTGSIASSSGVTVNSTGTFEAAASQTVKSLAVNDGTTARITTGALKILTVGDNTSAGPLTITGSGKVDLNSNALVVDYAAGNETAAAASVRSQLIAGYNNGNWQGNGITSSDAIADPTHRAVGYAQASDLLHISGAQTGTFLGQTVDASSILVRGTLRGDSNLDGAVGFVDLVAVAQHYGISDGSATWLTGDFTYDGNVDFADLVAVAQNYGAALPSAPIPGASASFEADLAAAFSNVPEPTGVGVIALAGLALLRRRRR